MKLINKIRRYIFCNITDKIKRGRMKVFIETMGTGDSQLVLDVGAGTGILWEEFCSNRNMRIFGIDVAENRSPVYEKTYIADARYLPFRDNSFDIVFSNSVIEHVGDFDEQKKMADEIMRVGKKYFVQAPNKHFPVEPHYFIPLFQYLPGRLRKLITKLLFNENEEIHLPTYDSLQRLFPGSTIIREKFFGLTKSFYVYKK